MAYDGDIKDFKVEVLPEDVVKRARDIIAKSWLKSDFAHKAGGERTDVYSQDAAQFCVVGAVRRAVFDLTGKKANKASQYKAAIALIAQRIGREYGQASERDRIIFFNDDDQTTHEDVVRLLS